MTTRAALLLAIALAACSSDDPAASPAGAGGTTGAQGGAAGSAAGAGGTGAASGSPAGQGGATAGAGGVAAGAGGQLAAGSGGVGGPVAGAAGAGGAAVCTPGTTQECVGPGACKGGQACKDDGTGYGACDCGTGGAAGAGGAEGGAAGEAQGGAGVGGAGASGAGAAGSGGEGGAAGAAGAPAVCGACPADLGGALWPAPTDEPLGDNVPVTFCSKGPKSDDDPAECWLRVDLSKAKLVAEVKGSTVTFTGTVPVLQPLTTNIAHMGKVDVIGDVNPSIQTSLGSSQNSNCSSGSWASVAVTWTGAWAGSGDAPKFGCSPLAASTAFDAKIPVDNVHICGQCDVPQACAKWDSVVGEIGGRYTKQVVATLRAALDAAATGAACLSAAP